MSQLSHIFKKKHRSFAAPQSLTQRNATMSSSVARASVSVAGRWHACRRPSHRRVRIHRAIDEGERTMRIIDEDEVEKVAVASSSSSLEDFVASACERMGRRREDGAAVTKRLRENWFESVEDVESLDIEDAGAMGIPGRLWLAMREEAEARRSLITGRGGQEEAEDEEGDASSGFESTSSTSWIGGELPSGDARMPEVKPTRTATTTTGRIVALADVRVTTRKRLKPFSLRGDEVSGELQRELDTVVRDLTSRRVGGGKAPVRERTALNHVTVGKQFMGWLARESEHASEFAILGENGEVILKPGVTLRDAFPSRESSGAKYAIEYVQWLSDERKIKSTTEDFQLRSLVALAKWVHDHVDDDGIAPPCVQELIRVQRSARERAKNAPHAADDKRKWLEWDQYLALVEHLKLECAPLDANGKVRSERDVAMSVQRYLLFAILACIPDRQRTLRELQLNKTLFKDESSGFWMVRHGPDDYKTGGAYGERPALVIDSRVYPALESWLATHRAALSPTHDFVFSRPNGAPWTVSELSRTFSRTALRVTGQKTNPHLIRDMIVTHVRSQGLASDAELEALARFMGHSTAMQKSTYDRRTQQEKVNPALSLMANVNAARRSSSAS